MSGDGDDRSGSDFCEQCCSGGASASVQRWWCVCVRGGMVGYVPNSVKCRCNHLDVFGRNRRVTSHSLALRVSANEFLDLRHGTQAGWVFKHRLVHDNRDEMVEHAVLVFAFKQVVDKELCRVGHSVLLAAVEKLLNVCS